MYKSYRISFFLLIISSFSCSALRDLGTLQKPTLSVSDTRITDLSLKDIELTFDVQVDNPNPVSVTLNNYTYDFILNEQSFVSGNATSGISIDEAGTSSIQVPVQFTYKELLETFKNLKNEDETEYTFLVTAGVDVPVLGTVEVPIEKKGILPVVKLPKIEVSGLKLSKLSLTKVDLELNLSVENSNNFDIALSDLNYNLDLNGASPFSGSIKKQVNLERKASSNLSIPLSFNILELGSAVRNVIVNGEQIEYGFTGSSSVGSSLPYFKNSNFSFDKKGIVDILN